MARRKNATFTFDLTYGSGHGDRSLVQAFYRKLNELYPGATPIPIPPESQIHPKHDAETQTYIFADFAVRKIVPIGFRALGLTTHAAKLEKLDQIISRESAATASTAASATDDTLRRDPASSAEAAYLARATARAVARADAACDADHTAAWRAAGLDARAYAVYEVAYVANVAAKLDHGATWEAVNEMLQAL